jgi:hypothetical protein
VIGIRRFRRLAFRIHIFAGFIRQSQPRRRLLSETRVVPRLMSGTLTNSRTVTPESSTRYFATSGIELGGLKFHCWRTISRNVYPSSPDQLAQTAPTNPAIRWATVSVIAQTILALIC